MEMLILGLTFINNSYFCCMTDFEKFIIEHADSDTASRRNGLRQRASSLGNFPARMWQ